MSITADTVREELTPILKPGEKITQQKFEIVSQQIPQTEGSASCAKCKERFVKVLNFIKNLAENAQSVGNVAFELTKQGAILAGNEKLLKDVTRIHSQFKEYSGMALTALNMANATTELIDYFANMAETIPSQELKQVFVNFAKNLVKYLANVERDFSVSFDKADHSLRIGFAAKYKDMIIIGPNSAYASIIKAERTLDGYTQQERVQVVKMEHEFRHKEYEGISPAEKDFFIATLETMAAYGEVSVSPLDRQVTIYPLGIKGIEPLMTFRFPKSIQSMAISPTDVNPLPPINK